MLKKFNLLVEEIKNESRPDYRFQYASRFLRTQISDKEKAELNKEYDEIVKKDLEDAVKSGEKIFLYRRSGFIRNCIIKKVYEKDGEWYCDFTNTAFNQDSTEPISALTTEKVADMMFDYEKELQKPNEETNKEAIQKIKESLSGDLKYIIDNEYLKFNEFLSRLSMKMGGIKKFYYETGMRKEDKAFNDENALKIFNVDTNSDEFKHAKACSRYNGEDWYYNGGAYLILTTEIDFEEGERFDFNRIKNIKYSYSYGYKHSQRTNNEF